MSAKKSVVPGGKTRTSAITIRETGPSLISLRGPAEPLRAMMYDTVDEPGLQTRPTAALPTELLRRIHFCLRQVPTPPRLKPRVSSGLERFGVGFGLSLPRVRDRPGACNGSLNGAGSETRTRDNQLGRLALYQLSYTRMVAPCARGRKVLFQSYRVMGNSSSAELLYTNNIGGDRRGVKKGDHFPGGGTSSPASSSD